MPDQKTLQGLFDLAQEKLVAKDYQAAKETLLKIKEEGYTSASVEASLARSLFESGDAGRAVVAWSNAIALDRFNSTYRSDLALAQSKIASGMGTKLEHPSEVAALFSSYARPKEQLFVGSLVVLAFIYLKISGLLEKSSKAVRILILLIAFLFLGSGLFSLSSQSLQVVVEKSMLRPAPLESAEGSVELVPGARVRVLRQSGAFTEIERPSSFRGWIESKNLSALPF